jgi:hypothetical protein
VKVSKINLTNDKATLQSNHSFYHEGHTLRKVRESKLSICRFKTLKDIIFCTPTKESICLTLKGALLMFKLLSLLTEHSFLAACRSLLSKKLRKARPRDIKESHFALTVQLNGGRD